MIMNRPLKELIDRGNDPTGFGHFGADRGKTKSGKKKYHKGHDIVSVPGEDVVSMIEGVVTKIGYAYSDALQFRYVEVTNDTYRIRLMYLDPSDIKKGDQVCEGDRVGYAMDISSHWHKKKPRKDGEKMINHIHVQIWKNKKLVDPKPFLK